MYPYLFQIGNFKVPTFGIFMALAMFLGIFLARKQAAREGVLPQKIESASLWAIFFSIVGARFLYAFVEHRDYFFEHPLEFFAFQTGGLSFLGSIFFAVAGLAWHCRRSKLPFWHVVDLMAPPLALGLAIGKIGCFMAGCCFGKVCDLPWGIAFHNPDSFVSPLGVLLHPSQLYEAVAWTALFFAMNLVRKKRKAHGELLYFFLVGFGIVRFFLEYFRGEPGYLGPLTTAQMLSIPLTLVGAALWIRARRQTR